jgi:hypothetical protein
MRNSVRRVFVVGVAISGGLLGAACSSSKATGPDYSITGSWAGVGQVDSVGMTVTQSGTEVSGTGVINGTGDNVTGTVNGASVTITFSLGNESVVYSGVFVTANQISGAFALSNGNEAIVFNRQ